MSKLSRLDFPKILSIAMKVASVLLGVIYFWGVLCTDVFSRSIYSMHSIAPDHISRIVLAVIRMIHCGGAGVAIVLPWFPMKYLKRAGRYFLPIVTIVNIAFFNDILTCYMGLNYVNNAASFYRVTQYIIENVLLVIIGGLNWAEGILNKEYLYKFEKKQFWLDVLYTLLIVIFACIMMAPHNTLLAFFGPLKQQPVDFTISHRVFIYACFLIPFVGMFALRNRTPELRHYVCLFISMAVFFGYFAEYSFNTYKNAFDCIAHGIKTNDVNSFPLHLCNTAVLIMFGAMIFKSKPLFYFNYLINILGAFFAVILPDTSGDAFYSWNIHYWENHLWVIALPFLARGLDLFPRPKLKFVLYALATFTGYFILVAAVDCIVGYDWSTGEGANYFFLNTDKYADFLKLKTIRDYQININGHIIFWLYWLMTYIVYVAFVFGVWGLFSLGYIISDTHYDLMVRNKKKRQELKAIALRKKNGYVFEETDMIEIKEFTKIYDKDKVPAVDNVTLTVNPGDIFGFLGHNGAGKSTLIKCLIGAQSITSGTIEVFGHNIATDPLETKKLIGYVPDNHATYEGLTGREYINYIANLYLVSTEDRKERLAKYADLFKISDALDKPIKSYSHGMKQKITIIASLIHDPKVWILDEPLTGLDPTSCYQIKECMREHASKGNIVFFSSHVIDVVENVCNRIGVISHGQLIYEGYVEEIKKSHKSLEKIYLKYVTNAESR